MSIFTTIILAAGEGKRSQLSYPKVLAKVYNKTLLNHTIDAFLQCPEIQYILPVVHPHMMPYISHLAHPALLPPVAGGKTRSESLWIGLQHLQSFHPTYVLVHDGARPFISKELIYRVLHALEQHDAVIPVIPLQNSLKKGQVHTTVSGKNRNEYVMAQTPQGALFSSLVQVYKQHHNPLWHDTSEAMEYAGIHPYAVQGETENMKFTLKEDFMLQNTPYAPLQRVTQGIDVHAFDSYKTGTYLGGVYIPHCPKLLGHSDADVLLHALTDALLALTCSDDIGEHFPSTNPKWQGISSETFVAHAITQVQAHNITLQFVDMTVVGEQPKINTYREIIRKHIATLLRIPFTCVALKATTTDKLGFLGQSKGLLATVTVTASTYPQKKHT